MALCLLLGAWLRLVRLERGISDFPPSDQFEYYQFHPDKETVERAALASVDPFDPPLIAYGLLAGLCTAHGVVDAGFGSR